MLISVVEFFVFYCIALTCLGVGLMLLYDAERSRRLDLPECDLSDSLRPNLGSSHDTRDPEQAGDQSPWTAWVDLGGEA